MLSDEDLKALFKDAEMAERAVSAMIQPAQTSEQQRPYTCITSQTMTPPRPTSRQDLTSSTFNNISTRFDEWDPIFTPLSPLPLSPKLTAMAPHSPPPLHELNLQTPKKGSSLKPQNRAISVPIVCLLEDDQHQNSQPLVQSTPNALTNDPVQSTYDGNFISLQTKTTSPQVNSADLMESTSLQEMSPKSSVQRCDSEQVRNSRVDQDRSKPNCGEEVEHKDRTNTHGYKGTSPAQQPSGIDQLCAAAEYFAAKDKDLSASESMFPTSHFSNNMMTNAFKVGRYVTNNKLTYDVFV